MSSLVLVDIRDSVAWLTLAAPPVNALSMALIDDLSGALLAAGPSEVRAVVIRAAPGARVFSAGHDVRELPTNGRDPLTYNDPLRTVVRQIETYPAPVIAMVEGSVWGGACELVLACDLVVASTESTYALTPARLGVPYNLSGILNFMKVADMHLVKEMLFTARPVTASRLAASGVVNAVVPVEELERATTKMAADITAMSPLVHRIMKEELRVLANALSLTPEGTSASSPSAARSTTARTTKRASARSWRSARLSSTGHSGPVPDEASDPWPIRPPSHVKQLLAGTEMRP
jgi:methylmalonyl-CoA decarboxylase